MYIFYNMRHLESGLLELDSVDKKTLHELDLDARMPISKIAKNLRISRVVSEYRISKMQETGLIRAFSSMMDPCKFGFSSWKVYLRFHNMKQGIEKKMIDYLVQNNKVWWVVKCYGKFDLLYSVFAESFYEFNEVINKFHELFGEYILDESINNHLEPQYFSRGYLTEKPPEVLCEPFMKKPVKEKIDETDISIMKELGKNCRIPLTVLASKLGITPRIASYRIKELMEKKIIVFNRLSLDVNKLGMDFYKSLLYLKNIDAENLEKLVAYCRQNKFINECVRSVGEWQMEIELEVNDFKQFNEIMDDMKINFPNLIIRTEPLLLHKEYKSEFNFLDYL